MRGGFFTEASVAILRSRITSGIVGSITTKGMSLILSFLVAVVLARHLGPADYGIYAFVYSLITFLAIPIQSGLPTLIVRTISAGEARQQWGPIRGLLHRAGLLVFGLAAIFCVVGYFIAYGAAQEGSARATTFLVAIFLLPLLGLGAIRTAALRGLRRIISGLFPEQVLRPGLFVMLLLVAAAAAPNGLTPELAMELHVAAALVAFVVGAFLLARALPEAVRKVEPVYETRAWLASLLPLSIISGVQIINSQAGTLIIGLLGTDTEVGIYRVAERGASLALFTFGAINIVIAPYISRSYVQGEIARLRRLITATSLVSLSMALAVTSMFVAFGDQVIALVFAQEYVEAQSPLVILCVGYVFSAAIGPVAIILNMSGHERDTALGIGSAAGLNVLLTFLLVPRYGIEGAAAATAVSTLIWSSFLAWKVYRHLNIYPAVISVRGLFKGAT